MTLPEKILQISKIPGVDQYIFQDNKGNIAAHDMKYPKKISSMVLSCGQDILVIGKNKFKYAVFSRKNKKSIIIFPVGNYSLGVVKQKDSDIHVLVDNILNFLQGLLTQKGSI